MEDRIIDLMKPEVVSSLSSETKKKIQELIKQDADSLVKKKDEILNKCVKEKLIKKSEIKKFSDDYLVEYFNALLDQKIGNIKLPKDIQEEIKKGGKVDTRLVFVTTSKEMLKRKKELNKRFDKLIIVVDPVESLSLLQEEMEKSESCGCPDCKDKRKHQTDYIG